MIQQPRVMPIVGLGGGIARPANEDGLADADRAFRPASAQDTLRSLPGGRRVGMKLYKPSVMGPSTRVDQFGYARPLFAVVRTPEAWMGAHAGHGLAVCDTVTGLVSRPVAVGHHPSGIRGSQLVGIPAPVGVTGLDDLGSSGIFTGGGSRVFTVTVDGSAALSDVTHSVGSGLSDLSPSGTFTGTGGTRTYTITIATAATPDTFNWTDGSNSGAGVAITGGAIALSDGVSVSFGATTGHTAGDEFTFTASPDTFQWSDGTNSQSEVEMTGDDQGVGTDGVNVRWGSVSGHTDGDYWKFTVGARPTLAGHLNRTGPHQYPIFSAGESVTLISNPFDRVLVDNGVDVIQAGIEQPYIKPRVVTENPSTPTTIGDTDADPVSWQKKSGVGLSSKTTVASANTAPTPASGAVRYVRLVLDRGDRSNRRSLMWHAVSGTVDTTVSRIQAWLYADIRRGELDAGTFSIIFDQTSTFTGTDAQRVVVKVNQKLKKREWFKADLAWPNKGKGNFAYQSVGVKLERSIDSSRFRNVNGEHLIRLNLDTITTDAVAGGAGATSASDLFAGDALWYFRFAWFRSSDNSIGALSPWSEGIKLNGTAVKLDLSGDYPLIPDGLRNAPPSDCDSVMVYAASSESGKDPRFGGAGLQFFRISPREGTPISSLSAPSAGQLVLTVTDEQTKNSLMGSDNDRDPFWHALPRPGAVSMQSGKRIITGIRPAYAVGKWTWTDESNVIVPVDSGDMTTTPVVGKWMEGRQIAREGERTLYRIIKALDTDDDGILDALFIARTFDADKQEFLDGYDGPTGDGRGVIQADLRTVSVTCVTEAEGEDPTNSFVLNDVRVMNQDDELVGFFSTGETEWFVGSKSASVLRQSPSALDDLPTDTGPPYSNPAPYSGVGLAGPRAWARNSDGTVYALSPRGELNVFSDNGVQKHPASARIASFFSGRGYVTDTENLPECWMAIYSPTPATRLIQIGVVTGATRRNDPGVFSGGSDEYTFTVEEDESGDDVITEEAHDFPWPNNGSDFWTLASPGYPGWPSGSRVRESTPMVHVEPLDPGETQSAEPISLGVLSDDDGGLSDAPSNASHGNRGLWAPPDYTANFDSDQSVVNKLHVLAIGDTYVGSPPTLPPFPNPVLSGDDSYWPESAYHNYNFGNSINPFGGGDAFKYVAVKFDDGVSVGPLGEYFNMGMGPYLNGSGQEITPWRVIARGAKIVFWVYWDDVPGKTLTGNKFDFLFRLDSTHTGQAAIYAPSYGQAGRPNYDNSTVAWGDGLKSGQWNLVVINAPSGGLSVWVPKDGTAENAMPGTLYDRMILRLAGLPTTGDGGDYAEDGTFSMFITAGRQASTIETGPPDLPQDPFPGTTCVSGSLFYDQAALESDFGFSIVVDADSGEVWPAAESPFTCVAQSPAASCAVPGKLPASLYLADKSGFIWEFADPYLFWGSPDTRFVFDVVPGGSTTVTLRVGTMPYNEPLAVDVDGDGMLADLVAAKVSYANKTVEYRRITSNGYQGFSITPAWDRPTADGDRVMIGPLPFMVQWPEIRTMAKSRFGPFSADVHERTSWATDADTTASFDPVILIDLFTAPANRPGQCDLRTARARKFLRLSELWKGLGWSTLPVVASRARAVRITLLQGQTGRVLIGNIRFQDVALASEGGK